MNVGLLSWRTLQNSRKFVVNPVLSNSLEHELRKFKVAFYLKKLGLSYYAEAIFKDNKGRADLYLPEKELAIEILESEEEARFAAKRLSYPCRVVAVRKDFEITLDSIDLLVN